MDSDKILLLAGLGILFFVIASIVLLPDSFSDCVGVLRVDGEIAVDGASGVFAVSSASSTELVKLIQQAKGDERIKSLLVEINSPGGSAVASKDIYDALRDTGKPSVAYLSEVAASGGYYVASGANWIVANPNTLTGSIGAKAELLNYEALFQKLGLRDEAIKSGELKDIGAGYRNMTDEERAILQSIIDEAFENFRDDVKTGRGEKVNNAFFAEVLDARVLTAKQALRAGLVDEIGGRKIALQKAASLGEIEGSGEPEECALEPPESPLTDLLSQLGTSFGKGIASAFKNPAPRLSYSLS